MKRKVFWAVVFFALGEVTEIYLEGIWKISIVIAMLICVVFFILRTKNYVLCLFCCVLMFFLGLANVAYDDFLYETSGRQSARKEYVSGDGNFVYFRQTGNPGEFNREIYNRARGIDYAGNKDNSNNSVSGNLADVFKANLYRICDEETASLYSGIILGDKSSINKKIKKKYQMAGISHILAISGLHISLIGMTLFGLLRKVGLSFLLSGAASIFAVVTYTGMTGWGVATTRALVMLILVLLGEILGKVYDLLTGLAIAVLVMLIINPYRIVDGSMLLSVCAVAGVAMGQYVLNYLNREYKSIGLFRKRHRHLYSVFASLVCSLCIQLMLSPMLARMTYMLPTYSILVNIIVVPLMTVVVASGILGLIISFININLAKTAVFPGKLVLGLYDRLCEAVISLPHNMINTGKISFFQMFSYYVLVFLMICLCDKKIRKWLRNVIYRFFSVWSDRKKLHRYVYILRIILICAYVAFCFISYKRNQCEHIWFLNVGQGDGILIETGDGTNLAIDCGSSTEDSLGEYTIEPAIKSLGMAHISYWFVSHSDSDHTSGLKYILDMYEYTGIEIDNLVVAKSDAKDSEMEELIYLAREKGINIIHMNKGDSIVGREFKISSLHPDSSFLSSDKNSMSLALHYRSQVVNALFTGDMDIEALDYMFSHSDIDDLRFNVVKIPHHGSRFSICDKLCEAISGGCAVISCGYGNMYGHPHKETLDKLSESGARVYRTDVLGAIEIRCRGDRISIYVHRSTQ